MQRGVICQAKNVLGLDVGRLVVILDLLLLASVVVRQAGQAATTAQHLPAAVTAAADTAVNIVY